MPEFIQNEVTHTILERRSIRKYKPEQLSQAQLDTLMTCGFHAPSSSNSQTWFVSVVQSPSIFQLLTEKQRDFVLSDPGVAPQVRERFYDPGFSAVFGAPTVLWFSHPKGGSAVNVSLMAENIVLAAHSLGLGTCYLGGILHMLNSGKNDDLLKEIGAPEGFHLVFELTVGYPDETSDQKPRDYGKVTYIR